LCWVSAANRGHLFRLSSHPSFDPTSFKGDRFVSTRAKVSLALSRVAEPDNLSMASGSKVSSLPRHEEVWLSHLPTPGQHTTLTELKSLGRPRDVPDLPRRKRLGKQRSPDDVPTHFD